MSRSLSLLDVLPLLFILAMLLVSAEAICPSGWSPAVGTIYDSWPKPGTVECVDYSGCHWAGQFSTVTAGPAKGPCAPGAKMLNGGTGVVECRWPEETVRSWSMASTYSRDPSLLQKKLEVMVEGSTKVVTVQVLDVCADSDCEGCCKSNTGDRKWKLIDLEKWAASELLGFDPSNPKFDVNNVGYPVSVGMRPGADESSVMPLCYKVVGSIDSLTTISPVTTGSGSSGSSNTGGSGTPTGSSCPGSSRSDWRCGPNFGNAKCQSGYCCSTSGWCGNTAAHCNSNLCAGSSSPSFGGSGNPTGGSGTPAGGSETPTGGSGTPTGSCPASSRSDWRCGPNFGNAKCQSGYCCSTSGWCGNTAAHCNNNLCAGSSSPSSGGSGTPTGGSSPSAGACGTCNRPPCAGGNNCDKCNLSQSLGGCNIYGILTCPKDPDPEDPVTFRPESQYPEDDPEDPVNSSPESPRTLKTRPRHSLAEP
eukprot:gene23707-9249_t